MAKVWVDPPEGWRYGFPKMYDKDVDGDALEWMLANGYPKSLHNIMDHYRTWPVDLTKEN